MNDSIGRARAWMGDFVRDVAFGARRLRRQPGFSAVALAMLALGIGASTATFSVVNAVLLRPLPFPDAEALVQVVEANRVRDVTALAVSHPNYGDWQARSRSWQALTASKTGSVTLNTGSGDPERLTAEFTTSNAFVTFGVAPVLGRAFLPEEDVGGGRRVVLLSHRLWRRAFGGEARVLDRTVTIDGVPHTVVGVAPPTLPPAEAELFLPLGHYPWPEADAIEQRSDRHLAVVGRLKRGVSLASAAAEMTAIAGQIAVAFPEQAGWTVRLEPLLDIVVGNDRRHVLLLLLAAVGVLLLIACANLGSLLLVSSALRTRELSVRAALGSTRVRHVRQLMAESLLLAGLGGAAGVLLAHGSLAYVRLAAHDYLPRAGEIDVDWRVLLFACAATALTAVLSGLGPALRATRLDVRGGLQDGGRAGSAARGPLRNALIVGQLALCIVLLAGAGLSLRTLYRVSRVDLGYEPDGLVTLRLAPTRAATAFFTALLDQLEARPEIEAAGLTSGAPLGDGRTGNEVFPVDPAAIPPTASLRADWRIVSGGYFQALGVPVLKGRVFSPRDGRNAPKVILVNETFARLMWGDDDPIGKRVSPGGGSDASTVVGVVGDVRMQDPGTPPAPAYYMSLHRGVPPMSMTLAIRPVEGAPDMVAAVRAEVTRLDPGLPVHAVQTGRSMVQRRLAAPRAVALLLAVFAALALMLAAVGVYGVMAHATAQRTREVGIRMALGAQPADVLKALLVEGGVLVALGTAIGLAGAVAASQWVGRHAADVQGSDPVAFCLAAALLMAVSLLACYVPARRALQASPLLALRSE